MNSSIIKIVMSLAASITVLGLAAGSEAGYEEPEYSNLKSFVNNR